MTKTEMIDLLVQSGKLKNKTAGKAMPVSELVAMLDPQMVETINEREDAKVEAALSRSTGDIPAPDFVHERDFVPDSFSKTAPPIHVQKGELRKSIERIEAVIPTLRGQPYANRRATQARKKIRKLQRRLDAMKAAS